MLSAIAPLVSVKTVDAKVLLEIALEMPELEAAPIAEIGIFIIRNFVVTVGGVVLVSISKPVI